MIYGYTYFGKPPFRDPGWLLLKILEDIVVKIVISLTFGDATNVRGKYTREMWDQVIFKSMRIYNILLYSFCICTCTVHLRVYLAHPKPTNVWVLFQTPVFFSSQVGKKTLFLKNNSVMNSYDPSLRSFNPLSVPFRLIILPPRCLGWQFSPETPGGRNLNHGCSFSVGKRVISGLPQLTKFEQDCQKIKRK